MCGWYFIKPDIQSDDLNLCQYFENGKQCQELGSVAFKAIGLGWLCGQHAYMLREQSFKK